MVPGNSGTRLTTPALGVVTSRSPGHGLVRRPFTLPLVWGGERAEKLMLGVLFVGLVIGVLVGVAGVLFRLITGSVTPVSGGGWPTSTLSWAGWGIMLGGLVALIEVLMDKPLRSTWGARLVVSSLGAMLGGLLSWSLWGYLSRAAVPAPPAGGS